MSDRITNLCRRLLWAERPDQFYPAAEQLQKAISERMDQIRDDAIGLAILDRLVDPDGLGPMQAKESTESMHHSAG
jgi:hypothetical protein